MLKKIDSFDSNLLSKIVFVKNTELSQLQTFISADNLEVQYGGTCQNIIQFW